MSFGQDITKFFAITVSFLVTVIIVFPLVLVLTSLVLICRALLSAIFYLFCDNKFRLMSSSDVVMSSEGLATKAIMTGVCYVKGNCQLKSVQERMMTNVIQFEDTAGGLPYKKMCYAQTQKFGFLCWSDVSDSFQIEEHVRLFPGVKSGQVFSEGDMFDILGKTFDETICPGKPEWEVLLIPKIMIQDSADVHFALVFRVAHCYMDGISMIQLLRNCVADFPQPLLLDPVNCKIPKLGFIKNCILALQTLLLGPYSLAEILFNIESHIFHSGKQSGVKFMTRSHLAFPLESMKLIRKVMNCSTNDIFNSVILGVLRKMGEKKGLHVPDKITGSNTFANLPYQSAYPENNFSVAMVQYPVIRVQDAVERLREVGKNSRRERLSAYKLNMTFILTSVAGLWPIALYKLCTEGVKCTYVMSNLPGFVGELEIFGGNMTTFFGVLPRPKDIEYSFGINLYRGKFNATIFVEKSEVISSRKELEELTRYFEEEILFLDSVAKGKSSADVRKSSPVEGRDDESSDSNLLIE